MRTTIFALSFAAVAAMTGSTGASAFGSLPLAHGSASTTLTPVTFYGDSYYNHGNFRYDAERFERNRRNDYSYKHHYWHKHSWYGYRGYCYYHPYNWRCHRHDW